MVEIDFDNAELDTISSSSSGSRSTGLSMSQTIYNGGRSLNSIKQAKINLDITKLNQRQIKIQVIQNVARSYFGLLQNQELYEVSEKNLNLSQQQVDLVQRQFDVGAVRKTDLLKAKVAEGQAKVQLLNQKTVLENARRQLFNDMGLQDFGQSISAEAKNGMGCWSHQVLQRGLLKTKSPSILIQKSLVEVDRLRYSLQKECDYLL